jgi:hypothetical protein
MGWPEICVISGMIQPRNIQFTRLIKAGGRLREFNFRKSQGLKDAMFTVDVASETGDRQYVIFRLLNQQWILENKKLESWVEEILPQIEKEIQEYK